MYPVRGEKDPQVTIIPESLNLLTPGPPLPQPPVTVSAAPPPDPGHFPCISPRDSSNS
ncbi:hypothetical protein DSO57_1025955 [Entomophthora muscae]|uniref:Uncharacterized protein n=1 Tax=Entomophthora muscae TaxID=34485 RepID=A0ACC2SR19_9FUNG|nr:hypothetical protein DSO57_1025955 [Entomophthora muscae]